MDLVKGSTHICPVSQSGGSRGEMILIVCSTCCRQPGEHPGVARPNPDRLVLGAVLRSFRVRAGLSQEALASRAGMHRTYVGQVERSERNPTFDSLERLLGACGVTWTEFGMELDRAAGRA